MRLRIHYSPCRPGLVLTDTPRPDCRACEGQGGWRIDYGDATGEYAGTRWESCPCWNPRTGWTLLPLPRLRLPWRRRTPDTDPWATTP